MIITDAVMTASCRGHIWAFMKSLSPNTSISETNVENIIPRVFNDNVEKNMYKGRSIMKGEQDLVGYYEQKYQEALQQLTRLGTGLERGDAYRDGQARLGQVKP